MIQELRKAFKKAKDDALSKMIYDLGKIFVIFSISLISLYFLPEKNEVTKFFNKTLQLTYFVGLIILTSTSFTIFFITSFFFKKQIRKLKEDTSIDELTGLLNHKTLAKKLE